MAATRKPVVEVRRSQRRRRTVSAYRDGERVVVLIPDQFSRAEETEWVDKMLARLAAREERLCRTDAELLARARRLIARHLDDYRTMVVPESVRWVTNRTAAGAPARRPIGRSAFRIAFRRCPSGSSTMSFSMSWCISLFPVTMRFFSGSLLGGIRGLSEPEGIWRGSLRLRAWSWTIKGFEAISRFRRGWVS